MKIRVAGVHVVPAVPSLEGKGVGVLQARARWNHHPGLAVKLKKRAAKQLQAQLGIRRHGVEHLDGLAGLLNVGLAIGSGHGEDHLLALVEEVQAIEAVVILSHRLAIHSPPIAQHHLVAVGIAGLHTHYQQVLGVGLAGTHLENG